MGKSAESGHADVAEVKVDKPVLERGGYSSSDRTASELPPPPENIVRVITDSDRGVGTEQETVSQES